ncbi:MAG TPA: G1 family glutamic endopeptidase, partial [Acidimicrobiales bacterium]|nr:G1 family glutamic endopeptidase [Acidimicrobiales bacterium]
MACLAIGALVLVGTSVVVSNGGSGRASATPRPFHGPVQIEKSSHGKVTSTNWSGYAVTYASGGNLFSTVSGSWAVPAVSCPNKPQESAFWVGIDGFQSTSTTVEQVGTDSDCVKGTKKHPGGPSYYAWWELYPSPTITIPTSNYPVVPGDTINAEVSRSGSTYTLSIADPNQD